jgi:adenosine deaminase
MTDPIEELCAIPKVELHVHLEGSMVPELTLALARKHRIDIGARTVDEIQAQYEFTDFMHFLRAYAELSKVLAEPDDFRVAVLSYGREAAAHGAIYAELTLTLMTHVLGKGMDAGEVMRAAWQGAIEAEAEAGIVVRFILDHVRGFPVEQCLQTLEWCDRFRDCGVVALGLGGPEDGWPASIYREAITRAAEVGITFVPHAGEASGPASIRDALEFAPPRIGHGVSAAQDLELVELLAKTGTMVEICATSNVRLRHVGEIDAHPARMFWQHGVPISVNTDDPPLFGTTLLDEYVVFRDALGFDVDELVAINRGALDYALAPPDVVDRLRARF